MCEYIRADSVAWHQKTLRGVLKKQVNRQEYMQKGGIYQQLKQRQKGNPVNSVKLNEAGAKRKRKLIKSCFFLLLLHSEWHFILSASHN